MEAITNYLQRLQTCDEITKWVESYAITGDRDSIVSCPFVKLLQTQFPEVVFTGPLQIGLRNGKTIDTPEIVARWMRRFDKGMYPQLVTR